jgi:hypothetical protein
VYDVIGAGLDYPEWWATSSSRPRATPGRRLRGRRVRVKARGYLPIGSASSLDQVQTILVVSKSTDISPLAFTVKCAWKSNTTLDPSDPRATT